MEEIKILIHYIKDNILTFILILTSPRSLEISEKIRNKEKRTEIATYLIFILILTYSIYISALKGSEILSIKLVKLVLYGFMAFIFQALVFQRTARIFKINEEFYVFFNTIAFSSSFTLPMIYALSPLIESDFFKFIEATEENIQYIPSIPLKTLTLTSLLCFLCIAANFFFTYSQIRLAINVSHIKSFLITLISYIINITMIFFIFGQLTLFAFKN